MDLFSLAEKIALPAELCEALRPAEGVREPIEGLRDPLRYERAANELFKRLSPDPRGEKILSAFLEAAAGAAENYRARKIPDEIYFATMEAFSRFAAEYRAAHGEYGFDAWWWAGRHTAMLLFRIGTLEYEMPAGGGREIALHVPTGADLSPEAVDASLRASEAFFSEFFPAYAGAPRVCTSWMLRPELETILPERSRIRRFAARFRVEELIPSKDYLRFAFGRADLSPEELPEKTSLQRELKKFLLSGNEFGSARGVLKEKWQNRPKK